MEIDDKLKNWMNQNEKFGISIKFGLYTEKILEINYLNWSKIYYLISLYIFFYEMQKNLELIHTFLFNSLGNSFLEKSKGIFDYLAIENHINYKEISFLLISVVIAQFLILIFLMIDFFFFKYQKIQVNVNSVHKFFFNVINFILLIFPYSLNYINIMLISNPNLANDTTSKVIYYLNLFNIIFFNLVYLIYIYFFNDISPKKNKYFLSTTNPIFHIINYSKFVLYNILLLTLNFLPKLVVFISIFLFLTLYLKFMYSNVFMINEIMFKILLVNTFFFMINCLFNILYCFTNSLINNYFFIIFFFMISVSLTFICVPVFLKYKYKSRYLLNNYKERTYYISDDMYIYGLFHKRGFSFEDLFKHKHICSHYVLEKCWCKKKNSELILNDSEALKKLSFKTCYLLRKIRNESSVIDLIYFYSLLSNEKINDALFLFLMKFEVKFLKIYQFHYLIRLINNFKSIYEKTISSPDQDQKKRKISKNCFNTFILYEFHFKEICKSIKKAITTSKNFWELVKQNLNNSIKFLKIGMEIGELTIIISKEFGILQKIHPNKIKLLKIFSTFLHCVLNEKDYVKLCLNLIDEHIKILSINIHSLNSIMEKDMGLLVISGESDKLFKIVSYNKLAKNYFGSKISLKNLDIHHLQPFPMNLIHLLYLRERLSASYISKKRTLYCLNESGDMNHISTNILPCMNFEGKLTYFILFSDLKDSRRKLSALVDHNGSVFAATRKFKDEFNLSINCSFNQNIELFNTYNKIITQKNIIFFNYVDIIKNGYRSEISFPYIYDNIEETGNIIKTNPRYISESKDQVIDPNKKSLVYKIFSSSIHKAKLALNTNKNLLILEKEFDTQISSPSNKMKDDSLDLNLNKNEDMCSSKLVKLIFKNGINYEMKMKQKKVLSGQLSYFEIILKKSNINILNGQNTAVDIFHKNTFKVTFSSNEFSSLNYLPTGSDNIIENKMKMSLILINYQEEKISLNSVSLIFKKIIILFVIIFFLILILNTYSFVFNLNVLLNYSSSCTILNGFLNIRERLGSIVMNSHSLINIRLKIDNNSYSIFKNKNDYLIKSLNYDINFLNNFLKDFCKTDLSDVDNIYQFVNDDSVNLISLQDNYTFTSQNYSLFSAVDIFISEVKEFVADNSFTMNLTDYYGLVDLNTKLSINKKKITFIFNNYFSSFRNVLKIITELKFEDCKYRMQKNDFFFYSILFSFIFSYLVIFMIVFFIVKNLYMIDNFLINIYSNPSKKFIENKLTNLKMGKTVIKNLKNDKDKDILFINKSFLKKTMSTKTAYNFNKTNQEELKICENTRSIENNISSSITNFFSKKEKFSKIKSSDFNENNLLKKKATFKSSIKNKYLNSESNLLNDQKNLEKNNLINNKIDSQSNLKYCEKINDSIFRFYILLFLKGIIFFSVFSYLFIVELYIYSHVKTIVNKITNYHFIFCSLIETNFLQLETLVSSISNNIPLKDSNNNELFEVYSNLFKEYHLELNELRQEKTSYSDEIKQKLNYFNSDQFCHYFYNLSNNYKLLDPGSNYNDCVSSLLNEGIEMYIFKLNYNLNDIYKKFKSQKNRKIFFLNELMNSNSLQFAQVSLGYYIRNYLYDIQNSIYISYGNLVSRSSTTIILIFTFFVLHLALCLFCFFFIYSKKIYFYFENIRILVSILSNDHFGNLNELKDFIIRFY